MKNLWIKEKVESNRKPEVDDSAEVTERKPAPAMLEKNPFLLASRILN